MEVLYEVGDTVWIVGSVWNPDKGPCNYCEATGTVTTMSGKILTCTSCAGSKETILDVCQKKWAPLVEHRVISAITIIKDYRGIEVIYLFHGSNESWVRSKNFPSSTCTVFKSREEAQQAADEGTFSKPYKDYKTIRSY